MNGRRTRIGLAILIVSLSALEIASLNGVGTMELVVISTFALIGLALFIAPPEG